jgi:hypothetical protein
MLCYCFIAQFELTRLVSALLAAYIGTPINCIVQSLKKCLRFADALSISQFLAPSIDMRRVHLSKELP